MNPYKVLGIRPNASLDEIKDAYESLANTYSINNFIIQSIKRCNGYKI